METLDWRHDAACREVNPEVFFPTGQHESLSVEVAAAKDVCRSCHVTSTCLTWALQTRQTEGIWGGLTVGERRTLVRRERTHRQHVA